MESTDTKYRILRNLKHDKVRYTPGQVVTGLSVAVVERLKLSGTIEEVKAEQPTEVIDVSNPRTSQAQVVGVDQQAAAQAAAAAAANQQAQVVAPPAAPVAPQGPALPAPGQPGGRPLTPQEQAVANTAAQVQ